jgi:predicted nuclease of predicted toxin-antitoxin system
MTSSSDLKFIIDVGVGRIIEEWLKLQDFTVISIATINPEMTDSEILKLADKEKAIIITMDKDFGELVFKSHEPHKGVLLLRLEDAHDEEKLAAIQNIFPDHLPKLKNNFVVYQNGKLRIRIIK